MARSTKTTEYATSLAEQIGTLRQLSEELADRMGIVLMGFDLANQVIDAVIADNPNAKQVATMAKQMIDKAKTAIGN